MALPPLIETISITNLAASATQAFPHQLNRIPDFIFPQTDLQVNSATATEVSVTNLDATNPTSGEVYLVAWHSYQRDVLNTYSPPFIASPIATPVIPSAIAPFNIPPPDMLPALGATLTTDGATGFPVVQLTNVQQVNIPFTPQDTSQTLLRVYGRMATSDPTDLNPNVTHFVVQEGSASATVNAFGATSIPTPDNTVTFFAEIDLTGLIVVDVPNIVAFQRTSTGHAGNWLVYDATLVVP